jgi:hypothetical protein
MRGVAEPPLRPVMLGALADARWTESNFSHIGMIVHLERPATVDSCPEPAVRKSDIRWSCRALIERLSNRQISAELDRLPSAEEAAVSVGQARTCRCGCGQPVTGTRKFVSQDHYSIWLSRERFVGWHRKRL